MHRRHSRRVDDRAQWGTLMAAAQQGDARAYRALLGELRPWLFGYYRRRLIPAQVEDAVQDALIAIHAKRHTYDPARPFAAWASGIARYKWIDKLRAQTRAPEGATQVEQSVGGHESAVTSATVLTALLATLKPAQADVIRLVKLMGFSIEEAAARTGQSESLVKVNIHRGLAKLAAAAADDADDSDSDIAGDRA